MSDEILIRLSRLPHEIKLQIYEEYLVQYYKNVTNIYLTNSNDRENRRAIIRTCKYKKTQLYICNIYSLLKPLSKSERILLIQNCNDLIFITRLLKDLTYKERKLIINICEPKYIPKLYKNLNTKIHNNEKLHIINKCHPEYIPVLYELMLKLNYITTEERFIGLKRCDYEFLPHLYKIINKSEH